jgi:hypothetical protein
MLFLASLKAIHVFGLLKSSDVPLSLYCTVIVLPTDSTQVYLLIHTVCLK